MQRISHTITSPSHSCCRALVLKPVESQRLPFRDGCRERQSAEISLRPCAQKKRKKKKALTRHRRLLKDSRIGNFNHSDLALCGSGPPFNFLCVPMGGRTLLFYFLFSSCARACSICRGNSDSTVKFKLAPVTLF